jgi:hypothetical protein
MPVAFFEVVLISIGLVLVGLGIYGVVRGKFGEQTSSPALGGTVTLPLSGLILVLGLCCIGYSGYLGVNRYTNSISPAANNSNSVPINPTLPTFTTTPAPKSSTSTHASRSAPLPSVKLDTPRNGTLVSEKKGFRTTGTVSSLGTNTLWILDYDGGRNYTIDELVAVTKGTWSATDGPGLGSRSQSLPFPLTMVVVVADSSCNAVLNELNNAKIYNISSLPLGCKVVTETTVDVSRP